MNKEVEYRFLVQLEQETSKSRYTSFTAFISISFVLPGLALRTEVQQVTILGQRLSLSHAVFMLGFLFFLLALFHYEWHHRCCHIYRKRLKKLESELDICVYRLRKRPVIGGVELHYDWALYITGLCYGFIARTYVGAFLFWTSCSGVLLLYALVWLSGRKDKKEESATCCCS